MFFVKRGCSIFHVLEDARSGKAPEPCGTKVEGLDLYLLQQGRPTPGVVEEKPPAAPLCKHCEKSFEGRS